MTDKPPRRKTPAQLAASSKLAGALSSNEDIVKRRAQRVIENGKADKTSQAILAAIEGHLTVPQIIKGFRQRGITVTRSIINRVAHNASKTIKRVTSARRQNATKNDQTVIDKRAATRRRKHAQTEEYRKIKEALLENGNAREVAASLGVPPNKVYRVINNERNEGSHIPVRQNRPGPRPKAKTPEGPAG